jgi:hypothetical protein
LIPDSTDHNRYHSKCEGSAEKRRLQESADQNGVEEEGKRLSTCELTSSLSKACSSDDLLMCQ